LAIPRPPELARVDAARLGLVRRLARGVVADRAPHRRLLPRPDRAREPLLTASGWTLARRGAPLTALLAALLALVAPLPARGQAGRAPAGGAPPGVVLEAGSGLGFRLSAGVPNLPAPARSLDGVNLRSIHVARERGWMPCSL